VWFRRIAVIFGRYAVFCLKLPLEGADGAEACFFGNAFDRQVGLLEQDNGVFQA
jgi:hypothetical protein